MNKRHMEIAVSRLLYVALFVIIQVGLLVTVFGFFKKLIPYFSAVCICISIIATLHILNSSSNPAYKLAWIIPIFLMPVFGGLAYAMFGTVRASRKTRERSVRLHEQYLREMQKIPNAEKELEESELKDGSMQSHYLHNASGCQPYNNTQVTYLPLGEDMLASMKEELRKAKRYIFMEYFIVEEGTMWNSILEILEQKVAEGVEVRFMYDDLGCLMTLPRKYAQDLCKKGIKAAAFNPFNTILSPRFNNRDHRKICVIDGIVGYTGGCNLADEYINAIVKHGHWKDTAVCLKGRAVWSLAVQFLSIYDLASGLDESYEAYYPKEEELAKIKGPGFVQPYSDIPLDDQQVGESAYINMIMRAKKYVYITTPYLIIDSDMTTALRTAALSGVDVRIITPHVPDKKFVFMLTRSYSKPLLDAGVKIFEYTPGFIHAKTFVSDDTYAIVGTINLDYRSLYLHLECAAWMAGVPAVKDVHDDFLKTESISMAMNDSNMGRLTWGRKIFLSILRSLAPLM